MILAEIALVQDFIQLGPLFAAHGAYSGSRGGAEQTRWHRAGVADLLIPGVRRRVEYARELDSPAATDSSGAST